MVKWNCKGEALRLIQTLNKGDGKMRTTPERLEELRRLNVAKVSQLITIKRNMTEENPFDPITRLKAHYAISAYHEVIRETVKGQEDTVRHMQVDIGDAVHTIHIVYGKHFTHHVALTIIDDHVYRVDGSITMALVRAIDRDLILIGDVRDTQLTDGHKVYRW
jgi:hypothetical protein